MSGRREVAAMDNGNKRFPERSDLILQSVALYKRPDNDGLADLIFVPSLTKVTLFADEGIAQGSLEIKLPITSTMLAKTLSWRKVNLPCARATLQALRTWAVVQIGF